MRQALRLARRGYGTTSPNPMVGAILVKAGQILGRVWHRRAGEPHAEINALRDAARRGFESKGATLYVTLEPCSTYGRTPPCTEALIAAGIRRVVAGATDPNPRHRGRGFRSLRRAGIEVTTGVLDKECKQLNEAFNHWIVHRTPFVTVKAAMTLDGKIATVSGKSKWITGPRARAFGMRLRRGVDAILVGVNTILADDPSLTFRPRGSSAVPHPLRRIILDSMARTPLTAKVVSDENFGRTTVVVSTAAPRKRVAVLSRKVRVLELPNATRDTLKSRAATLARLLRILGGENVTHLLVEGGGEVNASFLLSGFANRLAFFYAPLAFGGRDAPKGVAGEGVPSVKQALRLEGPQWRRLGPDLLLTARIA